MNGGTIFNICLLGGIAGIYLLKSKIDLKTHKALMLSREGGMGPKEYIKYCLNVIMGVLCFILILALKAQGHL